MKRKLFTLLVALIASAGTINAKKVVFDFTNPESLGITAPETGKGTPLNDSIIIVNGVTMTNKKVHPTDAQIWYAGGEYSFRTYKTSTLTFKADDYISAIEFDGISVLFNEIEFGKVWVGNTDSITFTATGRCIISKITLTVGEPANAWIPDTVTVAQARALIEANDTLDHFVKGIVASQPFNTYNAFSGRVNFYMVDDLAATDSLLACQVHAGQQLNASLLKLVGWASLEAAWEELRIGDTILVYANALNLNATNIYQIESGFYDSKLGANPNPPAIEYPVYDTITVAEAMEIGKALADNAETTEEYVVYGYAGTAYEPKEGYKDQTWYMADEPDVYSEFQAYRCTPDTLVVKGDFMYVKGKLKKYVKDTKVTIEICYGTAVHGEAPAPVELEPITVAQALEIAQALTPEKGKSLSTDEKYAVLGYVVSISQKYEKTYFLADEAGVYGQFQAFKCASVDYEVAEGDRVIVTGHIMNYYGEGSSGEYHNYEISGGTLIHAIIASDKQVDGIWYDFDDSNNTASVTYKGDSYSSYSNEYSGSLTIPASIYYNYKTYRVTSIGKNAFRGCTGLTSVTIPNSVTSMGDGAFYGCLYLTSVTIPNSITSIGEYAFYKCTGLASVTIPDSVTSIGLSAFNGCSGLTSVTIPESVESINTGGTFQNCTSLKEVYWNAINCNLEPYEGKGRYYPPFNNLSNITNFTFGDKVQKIPACLCEGLSGLTSVNIPENVKSIGDYAFSVCTGLTSVSIPKSVTSIGIGAFFGCTGLTSVIIPNSVTSIEIGAFFGCTRLTSITIPNSVTNIGNKAFYGCTGLTNLTFGNGIQTIGDSAFAYCKNFDYITCYATIVPTINATTFTNVGNKEYIYLYVPKDRERAYKRDEFWGEFDIQIKEAETTTTNGEVLVVTTDNTAEISWPIVNDANIYEIKITKDGEVFCVLKFNANGQLIGIAFALGRNAENYTQQTQTIGFKFIVTGLTNGTQYGYMVVAKDTNEQTIDTKSGSFTTTGGVVTDSDQIINDQLPTTNKILRDGQILILRGDRTYTLTGQEVR